MQGRYDTPGPLALLLCHTRITILIVLSKRVCFTTIDYYTTVHVSALFWSKPLFLDYCHAGLPSALTPALRDFWNNLCAGSEVLPRRAREALGRRRGTSCGETVRRIRCCRSAIRGAVLFELRWSEGWASEVGEGTYFNLSFRGYVSLVYATLYR